ncbi:topoisomerase 1-associated factor 1-like [Sesamum indicum]|uniref:Topoisomerase 1-associated factor 1-like n=1 Tax=Sesamum indicum TaxID=4182 RepID=A0A6I9SP00_SESIN|nr:topoisomerase 1-associated factor 1-like [Sesamum indicum]
MDSSKILEGTGECSSTESGWTTYIASPVDEHDHTDYDDDDDDDNGSLGEKAYKKVAQEDVDNVDSDDSMASDASSGPSDQGHLLGRSCGFGHAGNRAESKYVGKKHNQQEEKKKHHEQIKAEKDKSGNRANSAGRSKKT